MPFDDEQHFEGKKKKGEARDFHQNEKKRQKGKSGGIFRSFCQMSKRRINAPKNELSPGGMKGGERLLLCVSTVRCGPTLYKDEMTGTGASTEKTDETTTHKTPREDHHHHHYRRRRRRRV